MPDQGRRALVAGISGYAHSAAVAVYDDGALKGACQQERLTRRRGVGVESGGFPSAALQAVLETVGGREEDIAEFVVAEPSLPLACPREVREIDHHRGHAATAFFTSPFQDATVVVCDTSPGPGVTVWRGRGSELQRDDFEWQGPGFAAVYSRLTTLLGIASRSEPNVEALARLQAQPDPSKAAELMTYADGALSLAPAFDAYVENVRGADLDTMAAVAGSVQCRLAELLLEFLRDVARRTGSDKLCLGGGLFYNTYFNSAIRRAGIFRHVHVPVNPGNGGVASGCALLRGYERDGRHDDAAVVSPFLGPEYSNAQIKTVLDNCKLNYSYADDSRLVAAAVTALARGEFVGWFSGPMEWGRRTLGNRSIFASPVAPYALENLNRFLKHRAAHHTYGLAVRDEDAARFFEGPSSSPYMECEFVIRDAEQFSSVRPSGTNRLQVQTVGRDRSSLHRLLTQFGELTELPVLVNTSLNSVQEPIVCSPRDAIRVFYGTGIDVLILGNFILKK